MANTNNIKSGTWVSLGGLQYLFLGYIDYHRKRCLIADKYGNKVDVFVDSLK
jgi:hypothetical protein